MCFSYKIKRRNIYTFLLNYIGSFSARYWFIILLFIYILASRLYNLGADPPIHLSSSGGLFGDEMAYAHNARNKILFGNWITDGWNPFIYSPILTILEYLSFSVIGVGLVQLRLVNVIVVLFSFLLLFIILKKNGGERVALIAILLLGFNYVFLMYSRLGLNDTFLIFPITLTLYLWQKGLNKQPILFLAGMSSFACYVTKASALYFIIATFISLVFALFQRYRKDNTINEIILPLAYFLSGVGISFVFWYIFFFSPHKMEFTSISEDWFRLAMPSNIARFWHNLTSFTFPKYMSRTPIELVISWSYAPLIIYGLLKNWKKVRPIEIFVFLWAIGGYIALNGLNYRPLRYYVTLIPAICILASFALDKMWEGIYQKKFTINKVSLIWSSFFWLVYAIWIIIFLKNGISYQKILEEAYSFIVMTIILMIFFLIIQKIRQVSIVVNWKSVFQIFIKSTVVSIIFLTLYINGSYYLRWVGNAKYTVMDVSKELGKMLDQAYIAGLWSPLATIENRHKALYVGNNWFNYKDTFKKYPITHLFLWDGNNAEELRFLERAYPETMKRASILKIYTIKGLPVRLYKINNDNK